MGKAGMTEVVEMVAGLVAAQGVVPAVAKAGGVTEVGMVALMEVVRDQRKVEVPSVGVERADGWGEAAVEAEMGVVVTEEVEMEAARVAAVKAVVRVVVARAAVVMVVAMGAVAMVAVRVVVREAVETAVATAVQVAVACKAMNRLRRIDCAQCSLLSQTSLQRWRQRIPAWPHRRVALRVELARP